MSIVFRIGDPTPWKYFLSVSVALGILFAALSPDGTTNRGTLPALLQWQAQAIIPMALCIASHLALHRAAAFDRQNPWLKLLASGLLGAVLFSPLAYGIDLLLGEGTAPSASHTSAWLDEFGSVIVPVTFCWVAINAPFQLGYSFRRAVEAAPTPPTEPPTPPLASPPVEALFLSLIPAERRGEVLHMKSELHYLSVATTRGQSLILCTLRDAIRELPPDAGVQTHRSYWVNLAHAKTFRTDGRLATLTMSDGAEIPVSRSKVKTVKLMLGRSR